MNKEMLWVFIPAFSWMAFAFGGMGPKWMRRFLLPICLGIVATIAGIAWYKAFASIILLIGALCLPYGDHTPVPLKFCVGIAYAAATLPMGFTWVQIAYPIAWAGLYLLSLKGPKITWKVVEGSWGLGLGLIYCSLM